MNFCQWNRNTRIFPNTKKFGNWLVKHKCRYCADMPTGVGRNQTILWHIILLNRTIHNITEHSKTPYSCRDMSAVAAKFLRWYACKIGKRSKVQEKAEHNTTSQDSSKQNIRLILQVYERRKPQHLSVCISRKTG